MSQPGAPEPRIGDADREAAVTALGEHYAAGRISKDELDERADQAWAARTASDLWPLFADLPRPPAARPAPPTRPVAAPRSTGWGWLMPVVIVLGVLAVLTHLPLFLLAIGIWFLATRSRHGHRNGRGHHDQHRLR